MKGVRAKKSLGQNFLHSPAIISRIIEALKACEVSGWMEIGCGTGAITSHLCKQDWPLVGVELDRDLIPLLEPLFLRDNQTLLHRSFLELDEQEVDSFLEPGYGIIGNLPYYITTPIIERILLRSDDWLYSFFMVQKEFGERILASEGSRKFGRLSLFCQYFADVSKVMIVKSGCFTPAPSVDSMFVKFTKKKRVLDDKHEKLFFAVVKQSFSQRRKKMIRLLEKMFDKHVLKLAFEEVGIELAARAEQVSLEKWIGLTRVLGNRHT